MKGQFVSTAEVPPPKGVTLMVRSGGSVFDAALSPWFGWRMLLPGGNEEIADTPEEWWLTDGIAARFGLKIPPETLGAQPSRGATQGLLDLATQHSRRRPGRE